MKTYYVYILASKAGVLYTGFTNSVRRRTCEHKSAEIPGFSKKYETDMLVYYECFGDVYAAIEREKQIKTFSRKKKAALIDTINPEWNDLSLEWFT